MSSSIKRLPLWFRYLVAVLVGAAIVVGLIIFVHHNQQPLVESPAASNKSQQLQSDRQARVLVAQQQAPHHAKLPAHTGSAAAASDAVTAYMTDQVSRGLITGPLDGKAVCAARGQSTSRVVLRCNVVAGDRAQDTSLRYPFDVVVQPATAQVTFCQVVTSPDPSVPSPAIVASCR